MVATDSARHRGDRGVPSGNSCRIKGRPTAAAGIQMVMPTRSIARSHAGESGKAPDRPPRQATLTA